MLTAHSKCRQDTGRSACLALKPHSAQGTTGKRGRGARLSPTQASPSSRLCRGLGHLGGTKGAQEGRTTGPWEHSGHHQAELRTHLAPSQSTDRAGFSKRRPGRSFTRNAGKSLPGDEQQWHQEMLPQEATGSSRLEKGPPNAARSVLVTVRPGFAPGTRSLPLAFSLDLRPTVFAHQLRAENRSSSSHKAWLERHLGPWSARAVSQQNTKDPLSLLQRWTLGQQALVKTEGILQKPLRESCLSHLQTSALFSLVLEHQSCSHLTA